MYVLCGSHFKAKDGILTLQLLPRGVGRMTGTLAFFNHSLQESLYDFHLGTNAHYVLRKRTALQKVISPRPCRPCMYQRVGRGCAEQRRAATGRSPGPYACVYVCVRARRANPARRLPTGGGAQREPRSQRPTCPRPHRPPAPALPLGSANGAAAVSLGPPAAERGRAAGRGEGEKGVRRVG